MSDKRDKDQIIGDDLNWLAFCYVADELSPHDRDEFEQRLCEDQTARDAVLHATQLVGQLAHTYEFDDSIDSIPIDTSRSNRNKTEQRKTEKHSADTNISEIGPAARGSEQAHKTIEPGLVRPLALAVTVLIGIAAMIWLWTNGNSAPSSVDGNGPDQLATSWSQSLEQLEVASEYEELDTPEPASEIVNDETADWMMVALSDLHDSETTAEQQN